jgi:hypothetical protein
MGFFFPFYSLSPSSCGILSPFYCPSPCSCESPSPFYISCPTVDVPLLSILPPHAAVGFLLQSPSILFSLTLRLLFSLSFLVYLPLQFWDCSPFYCPSISRLPFYPPHLSRPHFGFLSSTLSRFHSIFLFAPFSLVPVPGSFLSLSSIDSLPASFLPLSLWFQFWFFSLSFF